MSCSFIQAHFCTIKIKRNQQGSFFVVVNNKNSIETSKYTEEI